MEKIGISASSTSPIFLIFILFIWCLYLKKFRPRNYLSAAIFEAHDSNKDKEGYSYCAICLNDIHGGDSYRKLPECNHCFHVECIDVWFKGHSTCPLCRNQVSQVSSHHENQWSFISQILPFLEDVLRKMCNPLNDELATMLWDNI